MSEAQKRRQKNPLYVVTNSGQDVESAKGTLDALLKKSGLAPFLDPVLQFFREWLEELVKDLFESVNSYAWLQAANQMLSQWIRQFELVLAALGLGPVVPHPNND